MNYARHLEPKCRTVFHWGRDRRAHFGSEPNVRHFEYVYPCHNLGNGSAWGAHRAGSADTDGFETHILHQDEA